MVVKMKRFSCILLTVLLMCASCGEAAKSDTTDTAQTGTNTDTEPAATEAPIPDHLDELGEKDFEGRVFTILDANDHPDMHVNMPGTEENGDIINDALYQRDASIEERYNIDLQYIQIEGASAGTTKLKNAALTDDSTYSICISTLLGGTLGTIALEGVLANLLEIPYLSLDQNWWSSLMYESLRFDNKMYYTTGDISPTMYQMPSCLYLNKSLAENYDIQADFPQLVRDGKWTWDEMISACKNLTVDVNGDNKMDTWDDFFGFVHNEMSSLVTNAYVVSAGIDLSTISEDGSQIKVDLLNEHTSNAIDKFKELVTPNIKIREFNDIITKTFEEDRALFLHHYVESASNYLRDMKSDYLILPLPKYDEAQESYRSFANAWADAFVAIPITSDPEFTGFITEALGYYSYKNVRPQTYEIMYKQKTTRDEDSAEMLDVIFNTVYVDFNCIYDFGGTASVLCNVINGKGELASSLTKIESKIDTALEKFITGWKAEK